MTLAIISHPDCLLHEMVKFHPECPERVQIIQEALRDYHFPVLPTFYLAPLAEYEDLIRVHDKNYVDWLLTIAPNKGLLNLDADTAMNANSLNAAMRAAGALIMAVELVMQEKERVVFCNVRPPGHHAEHDKAMGFCFFNNVAVGVAYALECYRLERIAIIDFDVHHGNGTQDIFQHEARVLYCSSFQDPFYPGYDAAKNNEHVLSIPLSAGTTGDIFREKVKTHWLTALHDFKPQLIFFSAGFDAHRQDPLADLQLNNDDYVWITQEISLIAKAYSGGKMISALEGGYDLTVLSECVPLHIAAMIAE